MTDLDRLMSFLTNANLAHNVEKNPFEGYFPVIETTSVTIGTDITNEPNDSPKVDGYSGFVHTFHFDPNGKLMYSGTWEE